MTTEKRAAGKRVGLLDIHALGPSNPRLLHRQGKPVSNGEALLPVQAECGPGTLCAMSIGLLLSEREDAVTWRAPMKHAVIKEFLAHVAWGSLDYLLVDAPPGTGDELIFGKGGGHARIRLAAVSRRAPGDGSHVGELMSASSALRRGERQERTGPHRQRGGSEAMLQMTRYQL